MTHDLKLVQQMLGHATPQMTLKHYDKSNFQGSIETESGITKSRAVQTLSGLFIAPAVVFAVFFSCGRISPKTGKALNPLQFKTFHWS